LKDELVGYAAKEIAKLQQDVGTKAEVIIDSGDVHKLLNLSNALRQASTRGVI